MSCSAVQTGSAAAALQHSHFRMDQFPEILEPYSVQLVHHSTLSRAELVSELLSSDLLRKSQAINAPCIESWLPKVASCHEIDSDGSVWVCHSHICHKYGLPLHLPAELGHRCSKRAKVAVEQPAVAATAKLAGSSDGALEAQQLTNVSPCLPEPQATGAAAGDVETVTSHPGSVATATSHYAQSVPQYVWPPLPYPAALNPHISSPGSGPSLSASHLPFPAAVAQQPAALPVLSQSVGMVSTGSMPELTSVLSMPIAPLDTTPPAAAPALLLPSLPLPSALASGSLAPGALPPIPLPAGLPPTLLPMLPPGLLPHGVLPAASSTGVTPQAATPPAGRVTLVAPAARSPTPAALRYFDLLELVGDTSGPINLEQAELLQKAIRSLKDKELANNLCALCNMGPDTLRDLLAAQGVNVREVLAKLVKHIDLALARQQFGEGYFFGTRTAYAKALKALQREEAGRDGEQARRRQAPQQVLAGSADLPPIEPPSVTLARLEPNSVKYMIFELLLAAGPRGCSVSDIWAGLQKRGITGWVDARAAKSSIASICAHEPALCRLNQGVFAVRALVPPDVEIILPSARVEKRGPLGGAGDLPLAVQQQRIQQQLQQQPHFSQLDQQPAAETAMLAASLPALISPPTTLFTTILQQGNGQPGISAALAPHHCPPQACPGPLLLSSPNHMTSAALPTATNAPASHPSDGLAAAHLQAAQPAIAEEAQQPVANGPGVPPYTADGVPSCQSTELQALEQVKGIQDSASGLQAAGNSLPHDTGHDMPTTSSYAFSMQQSAASSAPCVLPATSAPATLPFDPSQYVQLFAQLAQGPYQQHPLALLASYGQAVQQQLQQQTLQAQGHPTGRHADTSASLVDLQPPAQQSKDSPAQEQPQGYTQLSVQPALSNSQDAVCHAMHVEHQLLGQPSLPCPAPASEQVTDVLPVDSQPPEEQYAPQSPAANGAEAVQSGLTVQPANSQPAKPQVMQLQQPAHQPLPPSVDTAVLTAPTSTTGSTTTELSVAKLQAAADVPSTGAVPSCLGVSHHYMNRQPVVAQLSCDNAKSTPAEQDVDFLMSRGNYGGTSFQDSYFPDGDDGEDYLLGYTVECWGSSWDEHNRSGSPEPGVPLELRQVHGASEAAQAFAAAEDEEAREDHMHPPTQPPAQNQPLPAAAFVRLPLVPAEGEGTAVAAGANLQQLGGVQPRPVPASIAAAPPLPRSLLPSAQTSQTAAQQAAVSTASIPALLQSLQAPSQQQPGAAGAARQFPAASQPQANSQPLLNLLQASLHQRPQPANPATLPFHSSLHPSIPAHTSSLPNAGPQVSLSQASTPSSSAPAQTPLQTLASALQQNPAAANTLASILSLAAAHQQQQQQGDASQPLTMLQSLTSTALQQQQQQPAGVAANAAAAALNLRTMLQRATTPPLPSPQAQHPLPNGQPAPEPGPSRKRSAAGVVDDNANQLPHQLPVPSDQGEQLPTQTLPQPKQRKPRTPKEPKEPKPPKEPKAPKPPKQPKPPKEPKPPKPPKPEKPPKEPKLPKDPNAPKRQRQPKGPKLAPETNLTQNMAAEQTALQALHVGEPALAHQQQQVAPTISGQTAAGPQPALPISVPLGATHASHGSAPAPNATANEDDIVCVPGMEAADPDAMVAGAEAPAAAVPKPRKPRQPRAAKPPPGMSKEELAATAAAIAAGVMESVKAQKAAPLQAPTDSAPDAGASLPEHDPVTDPPSVADDADATAAASHGEVAPTSGDGDEDAEQAGDTDAPSGAGLTLCIKKELFGKNNYKCSRCHKQYHPTLSPLCMCDYCPRAYHLVCLEQDYSDLQEGEWACPKCMERNGQVLSKAQDIERRREMEMERAMFLAREKEERKALRAAAKVEKLEALEREKEEKARRRAMAREDKERRKAEEKAEKERLRETAREERERAKEAEKRAQRGDLEDGELLEEERGEIQRLQALLEELLQLAGAKETLVAVGATSGAPLPLDDSDAAAAPGAEGTPAPESLSNPLVAAMAKGAAAAVASPQAAPAPQGPGRRPNKTPAELVAETSEKLSRLRLHVEGPPPCSALIASGPDMCTFMDALEVTEFLTMFGTVAGTPSPSIRQLQHACVWPLDDNLLEDIYVGLLRYLLAQWAGYGGQAAGRVRRWARIVERGPWQEVLRRYLLLTRLNTVVTDATLADESVWALDDDLTAVQAALQLGKLPYFQLPAMLHLRLLHVLCNDAAGCLHMRTEITARAEALAELQAAKYHADAEIRKRERQAARQKREADRARRIAELERKLAEAQRMAAQAQQRAGEPVLGQTAQAGVAVGSSEPHLSPGAVPAGEKKKRGRKSKADTPQLQPLAGPAGDGEGAAAEGTAGDDVAAAIARELAGEMEAADDSGDDDDEDGGGPRKRVKALSEAEEAEHVLREAEWQRREAEHEAQLRQVAYRAEPLGTDRHHRRYWWLSASPGVLYVEEGDGSCLRYVSSCEELEAILARLNTRGIRERVLSEALKHKYEDIRAALCDPEGIASFLPAHPLDSVPRQPPSRGSAPPKSRKPLAAVEVLQADCEKGMLRYCGSEIEALASACSQAGLKEVNAKEWRRRARTCEDAESTLSALLACEAELSVLYEGLPPGGSDMELEAAVAEAELYEAEFVLAGEQAEQAGGAEDEADEGAEPRAVGTEGAAPAVKTEDAADGGDGGGLFGRQQDLALGAARARVKISKAHGHTEAEPTLTSPHAQPPAHAFSATAAEAATDSSPPRAADPGSINTNHPATAHAESLTAEPHIPTAAPHMAATTHTGNLHSSELVDSAAVPRADATSVKSEQAGADMQVDATATDDVPSEDTPGNQVKMVTPLEELEDSDTEEERVAAKALADALMATAEASGDPAAVAAAAAEVAAAQAARRHVALWHTARERAVWLKDVRRTNITQCAATAAYAAAVLADRCFKMLEAVQKRREEEAAERTAAGRRQKKAAQSAPAPTPPPEPTPPPTAAPTAAAADAPADVLPGEEPWHGVCSVCGLEGELLCCEGQDGNCPTYMHVACAGLQEVPEAAWYCPGCAPQYQQTATAAGANGQHGDHKSAKARKARNSSGSGKRGRPPKNAGRASTAIPGDDAAAGTTETASRKRSRLSKDAAAPPEQPSDSTPATAPNTEQDQAAAKRGRGSKSTSAGAAEPAHAAASKRSRASKDAGDDAALASDVPDSGILSTENGAEEQHEDELADVGNDPDPILGDADEPDDTVPATKKQKK